MTEVENHLLKIEDFVKTTKPDGTVVFTHPKLNDIIEVGSNQSPLWFFLKVRAFSEKHAVLMCPEMAKLTQGLEDDFHQGLQRFEDGLSKAIDQEFEDEFDDELFGDDSDFYIP